MGSVLIGYRWVAVLAEQALDLRAHPRAERFLLSSDDSHRSADGIHEVVRHVRSHFVADSLSDVPVGPLALAGIYSASLLGRVSMGQRAALLLAARCPGEGKQTGQQHEESWGGGGRVATSGTAATTALVRGASVGIGTTVFCIGIGIGIGIGISVDIAVAITVGVGVSVSFDIGISVEIGVGIATSIAICISVGVAVGAVR